MKNFGVGTKESYSHTVFLSQLTDGQTYWDARMVLFDFFYAYQCGYIKNFQPSPGFSINKEQLDKCIEKLDFEWAKEAKARAGGVYTGGAPRFADILEEPQKLALVERLLKSFPNWYENIEKRENAKPNPHQVRKLDYYD